MKICYETLSHSGIKGQKWGVRRYQNEDGTLTEEGKKRYGTSVNRKDNKHKIFDKQKIEEKKKEKNEEKEAKIKRKINKAIAKGDVDKILKYASKMSTRELEESKNRIELLTRLKSISDSNHKKVSTLEKMSKFFTNTSNLSSGVANTIANINKIKKELNNKENNKENNQQQNTKAKSNEQGNGNKQNNNTNSSSHINNYEHDNRPKENPKPKTALEQINEARANYEKRLGITKYRKSIKLNSQRSEQELEKIQRQIQVNKEKSLQKEKDKAFEDFANKISPAIKETLLSDIRENSNSSKAIPGIDKSKQSYFAILANDPSVKDKLILDIMDRKKRS